MKKYLVAGTHVLAWTLVLVSNVLDIYPLKTDFFVRAAAAAGVSEFAFSVLLSLCYMIVFIVAFYGAWFWVGPYIFSRKNYPKALLGVFSVLTAMVVTRWLMEFGVVSPLLHFNNYPRGAVNPWYYISNCILFTYKYSLLGLLVYFLLSTGRIEKEKQELDKQKLQAELALLRSQVNPHFLFNTVNDIYSLSYQKNEFAPQALLKLAGMLRYMLDEGGSDRVGLATEINYLQDYIELQRIGMKGQLFLEVRQTGNRVGQSIAPMLLIALVENIFKHGVLDDPAKPAMITIAISEHEFNMVCSNSVKRSQKDSAGGIGLHNVRRRLELIYPNRHEFKMAENGGVFVSSVKIAFHS